MEYIWKKEKYFEQFCSIENIDSVYPFNICKKCNEIPFIDIINGNDNNYLIKNKCKCHEEQFSVQEFVNNLKGKKQSNPLCFLRTHETRLGVEYCINCQKWFCVECLKIHLNTNKHKAIPYQVGLCPKHKNIELTLYCPSCQAFFCKNCDTSKHQKHTIMSVQDISSDMNYFTKNYQKMKNVINDVTKNLESLKKCLQNFENNLNLFKIVDNMLQNYNCSKWKLFSMVNLIYNWKVNDVKPLQKNYNDLTENIRKMSKNFDKIKSLDLFFESREINNKQVQYITPIDEDTLIYWCRNSDVYRYSISTAKNTQILNNNKVISYLTVLNKTDLFFYTSEINIKSLNCGEDQATNITKTIPCEVGIVKAIQTNEKKIIVLTNDNAMTVYDSKYKKEKKLNVSDDETDYPPFARSVFEFEKQYILISLDGCLKIYDLKNDYSGLKISGISSWGTDSIIQIGTKQLFIGGLESSWVVETSNWKKFSNVKNLTIGFNCIKRVPGTFYLICGDYNGNIHLYYLFGQNWYSNQPIKILIQDNITISNIYCFGNQQIVSYNKDGNKIYKIISLTGPWT